MPAEPSVADLLAFEELPDEIRKLALRVFAVEDHNPLAGVLDEAKDAADEAERELENVKEDLEEARDELREWKEEALAVYRFAVLAIGDRARDHYWSDGDLEEKLAEAGLLEAVEVDEKKTGCKRAEACPCEVGDRCYRGTEAGRLALETLPELERLEKARLERVARQKEWKERRDRERLLLAAAAKVKLAAGEPIETVALARARANTEPGVVVEFGDALHRTALAAIIFETEPRLAGAEVSIVAVAGDKPGSGAIAVSLAHPKPKLEVVR